MSRSKGSKRTGRISTAPNMGRATASTPAPGKRIGGRGRRPDKDSVYNVFEHDENEGAQRLNQIGGAGVDSVSEYLVDTVDPEDDEEIDSDEAFGESDDEDLGNVRSLGKSSRSGAAGEVDLDEDERTGDEDEVFDSDDGMIDISDMLTGVHDSKRPVDTETKRVQFSDLQVDDEDDLAGDHAGILGDAQDNSEGEDSQDGGDSDESEVSDREDDGRIDRLDSFISSLGTRKKKYLDETDELVTESEFNLKLRPGIPGKTKAKLDISDLIGSLGDDSTFASTKKVVGAMESIAKSRESAGTVSVPLPKRLQDQLERESAYKKTKESVSEWAPLVYKNREAAHLSFPTMNGEEGDRQRVTNDALVDRFQSASAPDDFEAEINKLLEKSGMKESQLNQYEELELKKLSVAEARERRNELRMMRELMFRQERKTKRLAKIKSKAYRRILKKQKVRQQEQALQQLMEEDPEAVREEQLKMARKRAEERMTLRHKNTGKWAQSMIKYGKNDPEAQKAIQEQLNQHEALKRKIHDLDSDEDLSELERNGGDFSESDYDDGDSGDAEVAKARAMREIDAEIAASMDRQAQEAAEKGAHKGLFNMKFMQKAIERSREQELRDAEALRLEIADIDAEADGPEKPTEKKPKESANMVGGNPGRLVFSSVTKSIGTAENISGDRNNGGNNRVKTNDAGQVANVASKKGHSTRLTGVLNIEGEGKGKTSQKKGKKADINTQQQQSTKEETNPWLNAAAATSTRMTSGKANLSLTNDSSKADKSLAKLNKKKQKSRGSRDEAGESEIVLNPEQTLKLAPPLAMDNHANGANEGDDDDVMLAGIDGDVEMKTTKTNPLAISQRELVERAFANDEVVEKEFAEEKANAIEADRPKDEDLTLPGWGSWGGTGIEAPKGKVVRRAAEGVGLNPKKRKDAHLSNVIINEKKLKAASKYQVEKLPYLFKDHKEYEQTIRMPIGKEWNTTAAFNRMIKPKVITHMGKIINPLTAPFKKDQ